MLLLSTVTLLVPWIIIYFASSLTMLYVGRAMGGIGFACVAAVITKRQRKQLVLYMKFFLGLFYLHRRDRR